MERHHPVFIQAPSVAVILQGQEPNHEVAHTLADGASLVPHTPRMYQDVPLVWLDHLVVGLVVGPAPFKVCLRVQQHSEREGAAILVLGQVELLAGGPLVLHDEEVVEVPLLVPWNGVHLLNKWDDCLSDPFEDVLQRLNLRHGDIRCRVRLVALGGPAPVGHGELLCLLNDVLTNLRVRQGRVPEAVEVGKTVIQVGVQHVAAH
mmetsp:Transcript_94354/g.163104  ORF Transcript_94354/g.163104 Transcript_94354/m.163104 type:complete len:205 (+) Transcript_94354:521-1135(+)